MIGSGAGICVYKYEVEQIKRLCLFFTYLLSFARGGIRQKVFNDLYYFHKEETFWETN